MGIGDYRRSMKPLKCEICGSSELTKKDGMFVCDYCGTKYTVEEAKKMLEGKIDISGSTIKIDSSDRIRAKMQLAMDAYRDRDYGKASSFLDEITRETPDVPDAWYLMALLKKKGDQRVFERYVQRGDENKENSLGFLTREEFLRLMSESDYLHINIGYMNRTDRPVDVKINGNIVLRDVRKDQGI